MTTRDTMRTTSCDRTSLQTLIGEIFRLSSCQASELLQTHDALEDFLKRLARLEPASSAILRGAVAARVWMANSALHRLTWDLDFLLSSKSSGEEAARSFVTSAYDRDDDSRFRLLAMTSEILPGDSAQACIRCLLKVTCEAFQRWIQVDVGFTRHPVPSNS